MCGKEERRSTLFLAWLYLLGYIPVVKDFDRKGGGKKSIKKSSICCKYFKFWHNQKTQN